MARESLTVNGFDLMEGTYRDTEEFVRLAPAPVGENPVVAGRTGAVWRAKRHGPGAFFVTEWVGHPTEDRAEIQARWDEMLRHIARPMDLSTVVWTLSDGSTRTCQAELVGEIQPAQFGQRGWRGQLEFSIPYTYWFGGSDSASDTGTSGTVTLTWQAPSSAPLEHLVYTCTGPFSTITVTSPSTGDSFTYAKAVGAGETLVVDSGEWTVVGGGGHTADPRELTYTDDGRFLTVLVGAAAPTVTYTSTGGSASTALQVAGETAYL